MVRRTPLEIKAEILENSRKKIKPTNLMRDVNLSWQPLQGYIEGLKNSQLIEEIPMGKEELKRDARTRVMYCTTTKGIHAMNAMKAAIKSIE